MSHPSAPFKFRDFALLKKIGQLLFVVLFTSFISSIHAQERISPEVLKQLKAAYLQDKQPEISFQQFVEINHHVWENRPTNTKTILALSDYCNKVRPYCTNGDFETGLDQTQYVGAYGAGTVDLFPSPFTNITYGFLSGPINSGNSRQTIVNKTVGTGLDPITNIIPLAPSNGGNQSLRLGNAITGDGYEMLAKTIVVDANETILNFSYAVVFEDPNHNFNEQPAFSVRVYDCNGGAELANVCNLGNNSNVVVSDAQNPFFQSLSSGSIAYRNWSQGQINLSAHIGKTVTIIFTNKDCSLSGHYGYTYIDNLFSTQCPIGGGTTDQGDVNINSGLTTNCGVGQICVKYKLPSSTTSGVTTTGTTAIALNVYQSGTIVTTLNSPTLSTYSTDSTYCFAINPSTLGVNTSLNGFDYTVVGTFVLGAATESKTVGNPPTGVVAGQNNDYLISCVSGPIYYSKANGDLHNVLTWGLNPDGSGPNPTDFNDSTFQLANRPGVYTMTADWTVNGGLLNIPAATQLQINGFTFGVSDIAGAGTITGSLTSNLVALGSSSNNLGLSFTASANLLNNFTVNRTGAGTANILNALNVYNVMTLTTGTLNTGGLITLKSTAVNTARVAAVTGIISGDVTVERYIPMRRAWRILSAPVTGNQTVNQAWQEGTILGQSANPDPFPGFGTHITGGPTVGTVANGFDQNPVGAMSSIKAYINNTWQPLPNTNASSIGGTAYMTFVRGNRALPIGYNDVPPSITTLRAKGPLRVGDQTFPVAGTGFTAVGNPYPSPIDFATITRNGVQNNFYLWDPKLGGTNGVGAYVLLSFNGVSYDITPTPVSPESQYIQSGQGFLVRPTTNGVPGSIVIKESDKSSTAATDVFRLNGNSTAVTNEKLFADPNSGAGLRVSLYAAKADGKTMMLDEVFASYKASYSNKIDDFDAVKLDNIQENLGIVREGQTFMVERKALPKEEDAIDLKLWNTEPKTYTLEFNPVNLLATGLTAIVEDKHLNTFTKVSLTESSQLAFIITSDPASARTDRFRIILTRKGFDAITLVEDKTAITAYPNPIDGRSVNLSFANKPQGMYNVILINSVGQVVFRKNVQHAGGTAVQTLQLDKKLVKGLYQLQISGKDGSSNISISSN